MLIARFSAVKLLPSPGNALVIMIRLPLRIGAALLPVAFDVVRPAYLLAVAPASVAFALLALRGPRGATRERWARRVFFASMPYLIVVCGAFVATA